MMNAPHAANAMAASAVEKIVDTAKDAGISKAAEADKTTAAADRPAVKTSPRRKACASP